MKLHLYSTLSQAVPQCRKLPRQRNLALNLINAKNVKARFLHYSKTTRAGKYTRVGKPSMEQINRAVDEAIQKIVRMARGGKTL